MEFEKKVVELDVNDVLPNRFQPRIKFNEESINELSDSIKEHGVIQPIVVRAMGDKYEIIAGERRYKASLLAGKQTIPAVITNLNDKDSAEVALIENVQRKDLTPIEEAISYKKILDMGYLTQEELATKLGKNQSTVANKLRLLNLAEEVQEAVLEEKISERHARSLLKLQNQKDQIDMLNKIIDGRLTVRKADEEIAKLLKPEPVVIDTTPTTGFNIGAIDNDNFNKQEGNDLMMNQENNSFIGGLVDTPTEEIIDIPTEPVMNMEEAPRKVENMFIEDEPIKNSPELYSNPGFMDVNKIEQNAMDINVPKETANIDSLLEPTYMPEPPKVDDVIPVIPTMSVEPQVSETPQFDMPQESKFFRFPIQDEEPEATNNQIIQNVSPVQVSQDVANLTNSVQPNASQDSLFNFNFDNVVSPDASIAQTPTPVVEEPVPNLFFGDMPNSSTDNNMIFNNIQPEPTPIIEEIQPVQNIQNNNIVQPMEEVKIQETIVPSISTVPEYKENVVSESVTMPSYKETPIAGEELPIPSLVNKQPVHRNVADAINIIRNCTNQLEQLGFTIDTEEIDFESMYQIIIKINK